jgi:hypothetical protein
MVCIHGFVNILLPDVHGDCTLANVAGAVGPVNSVEFAGAQIEVPPYFLGI